MFVGKNIHFSALDHKPLCSFSAKLCRQRRLNGYAFCARHILEDPSAPFKACAFVTKYSRNNCSNPVPKHDERLYCNNHLQVVSGTNKKEKKVKVQPQHQQHVNNVQAAAPVLSKEPPNHAGHSPQGVSTINSTVSNMLDNRMTLQDRLKTKFNLCQKENGPEEEDLDDPYAFPDSEPLKPAPSPVQAGPAPVTDSPPANHVSVNCTLPCSLPLPVTCSPAASSAGPDRGVSCSSKVSTPENSNHGSTSSSSATQAAVPIAKLYPELAEKLERARVKPEVKLKQDSKSRSSTRSSRTMNQLQTRIAQNKIKDKLKKNQGQSSSNQATPEHQPSTPQPQLSPLPAGCGSGSGNSSVVSVLQTALTPDPMASPKLPFPCSTLNVNVKNALSNMLKSDSAAITSIPIGLPRHLLHHTPAPPPTAHTVSAQLQHQQQKQHLQLQLNSSHKSAGQSECEQASPSSVAMSSSHVPAHLSPARAASPPKVSQPPETSVAVAAMVTPSRGLQHHVPEFPVASTTAPVSSSSSSPSSLPVSVPIPHHQPCVSLAGRPSERVSQGVLPPPYPHPAPSATCTSQLKHEPQKSPFMQQLHQVQKQQFQQPQTGCSPVSGLSPLPLGPSIPSRPPPAYPHPVPTTTLTGQGSVTTTVTTSTATCVLPLPTTPSLPSIQALPTTPSLPSTSAVVKSPIPTNCTLRPKRPRNLLTGREAKKRLKRHSSVKVYAYHASQKMQNMDLLPFSVDDTSDDSDYNEELPWQKNWYVPSSDEEAEDDDDDSSPLFTRTARLGLLRARLRRQFSQLRQGQRVNSSYRCFQEKALQSLLVAAKHSAEATSNTVLEIRRQPPVKKRCYPAPSREQCNFSGDENEESCQSTALPFTNHCVEHIMQCADQQIFDHCTAKFSDNSQCCVPVFDIRHELPLCPEHAAKADNYNKNPEPRPKKPRKKTKPSALTRPPKKGKKKKNQRRNVRPQKPMPPLEPTGNTAMPDDISPSRSPPKPSVKPEPVLPKVTVSLPITTSVAAAVLSSPTPPSSATSTVTPKLPVGPVVPLEVTKDLRDLKDITHDLDKMDDLGVALSPGAIAKNLDLPIDSEQATNFLDEHDLHDVLTRLPEEAFDIFSGPGLGELSKNGEFLPSKEEAEELERALAEASQDVDSFKQSLKQLSQGGTMLLGEHDQEDEIAKQIADQILQQDLSPSHLDDDLNQDNINDLASSISASDLSNFSQAFSSANMTVVSEVNNHQGGNGVAAAGSPTVVSQLQRAPQTTLQTLQVLRSQGQLQGQQQQQPQLPAVIQTQFAGAQLPQGLHIQGLPAGLTAFTLGPQGTLIPTVSSVSSTQQRALLADHLQQQQQQQQEQQQQQQQHAALSRGGDRATLAPAPCYNSATSLASNNSIAPNITITQNVSQALAAQPLTVPITTTAASTVQWGHVGTVSNQNQIRFQNRFPLLQHQQQQQQQQQQHQTTSQQQQRQQPQQTSTTQQSLAASLASQGMKLAFPLQSFIQTDLGAMIAATSSGEVENSSPDFSLSLSTPGLTSAQPAFNLATTTVVSASKTQPPAST